MVSFSVNSIAAGAPSCPTGSKRKRPSTAWFATTVRSSRRTIQGLVSVAGSSVRQDQLLRSVRVGSSHSAAGSGPRLVTVSRISVSSTSALAYSTVTSK